MVGVVVVACCTERVKSAVIDCLLISGFLIFSREDDDINDVATMGGVNLSEESRNILSSSTELIGAQLRSCRDEPFLDMSILNERIQRIGK